MGEAPSVLRGAGESGAFAFVADTVNKVFCGRGRAVG